MVARKRPLEKQPVLLTSEPCLQPQFCFLKTALEERTRGKHLKTTQAPPGKPGTFSAHIPFHCTCSMQLRHEPSLCDRRTEACKVAVGSWVVVGGGDSGGGTHL